MSVLAVRRACARCLQQQQQMLLVRRASSPAPWSSSSRSFTSSSRRRLPDAGPPSAKPTNPGFSAPLAGSSESSGPQPGRARGPNNLVALGLFVVTGVGLYFYFANEKEKVLEKKKQDMATKSVGRVRVGGPFELVDVRNGQPFSEKDLLGKFSLLYFGFTNCPDICPEELDKMTVVVERLSSEFGPNSIVPIFVTVDPARDTPEAIKKYLRDFHPSMVGLTGPYQAIKDMCRTYRVYFSTPPDKKPGEDYLVDHSIFFYLMSPNGFFVDAFGRIYTKDEVHEKVRNRLVEWREGKRPGEEDTGL